MDNDKRLFYRVQADIEEGEVVAIFLAALLALTCILQAIWYIFPYETFLAVIVFLTFLFTTVHQRILTNVQRILYVWAHGDDKERRKLLDGVEE